MNPEIKKHLRVASMQRGVHLTHTSVNDGIAEDSDDWTAVIMVAVCQSGDLALCGNVDMDSCIEILDQFYERRKNGDMTPGPVTKIRSDEIPGN